MSQNINDFFADRKAAWLKSRNLAALDETAQSALQNEADERFSLAVWLPDAAKRAGQLFMSSHPSKFSHPSAKTSSVIAINLARNDGYLRTGNAEYRLDVSGNAAAMDVYKFLSLKMDDDQTVLAHLEADTDAIKTVLDMPSASFDDLKKGFLQVKVSGTNTFTDGVVKQIYFPVSKNSDESQEYHLLSILTPSGLLARLKRHIDEMRFSEATKEARELRKKNQFSASGYNDIFGLTVTAYGGTKPQNISTINSQNGGVAYLLPCIPPNLIKRDVQLPTQDFFKNSLRVSQFKAYFLELHQLMKSYKRNTEVSQAIKNTLKTIIDEILARVFQIRASAAAGWSQSDYYQGLPLFQCIWLDEFYNAELTATDEWATGVGERQRNHVTREEDGLWLDAMITDCARWIVGAYKATVKKDPISLGDDELAYLTLMVDQVVTADKEFFV